MKTIIARVPLVGTALLLLAFAALHCAGGAQAEAKRYGNWRIRCDAGSSGQCGLTQSVVNDDGRGPKDLGASLVVLRGEDGKALFLRLMAPLSVDFDSGIAIALGGKEGTKRKFARCATSGCIVEFPLSGSLLAAFRAEKTVTIIVWTKDKKGYGLPASLAGFNAGVKDLK